MRLLIRSNSHREVSAGGVEIAASPDTPRRETWQWHVRVIEPEDVAVGSTEGYVRRASVELLRGNGRVSLVEVSSDARAATPTVDVLDGQEDQIVERDLSEIVVIVVGRGSATIEGRHILHEMDTLILEGDDPYSVSVEHSPEASVAVARLHGAGSRAIGWVP